MMNFDYFKRLSPNCFSLCYVSLLEWYYEKSESLISEENSYLLLFHGFIDIFSTGTACLPVFIHCHFSVINKWNLITNGIFCDNLIYRNLQLENCRQPNIFIFYQVKLSNYSGGQNFPDKIVFCGKTYYIIKIR